MSADKKKLTQAFFDAGAALGEVLARELVEEHPALAAALEQAVGLGERMELSAAFDPEAPRVRLSTVNDYGSVRVILEVRPEAGSIH